MLGAILLATSLSAQLPRTIPEQTDYASTSRYEDVMAFIKAIEAADPDIRVQTFAVTNEGRALPLVLVGSPAKNKPVIFIMANIHAGEVEGKEASLMLLRDLVSSSRSLRKRFVILIAPIYNADGNEKISPEHRPRQVGPANGVGVRENAQGLDLNRDFMKLESPEARGLVSNVLQKWDPLLTIDLHTTNGSFHGYQLTYSPMLNPNASAGLIAFERETLLPEIRTAMKKKHGKEIYYYGNFAAQLTPEKGWYTFDSRPRFGNNYVGLRNRFTILSEAYAYIDFRARVEVTYQFLHEILDATSKHLAQMTKLVAQADAESRKLREQGVRFEVRPWKKDVPILWERTVPAESGGIPDPETGSAVAEGHAALLRRTGEIVPMKMIDYGIFEPTETAAMPFAYAIPSAPQSVIENLKTHGIVTETLERDTPVTASQFEIAESTTTARPFQKHTERTLRGTWIERPETLPAGTLIVRTDQPLARLAFYLLEPRSDDGLFNWNFFDPILGNGIAPVRKLMKPWK